MSKTKKIVIALIALIVIICCAVFVIIKMGVFDKSNYKYLNYDKYVKVGNYKGLTYTKVDVSVSQKEIEAEITARRQAKQTTKTVKTGVVKKGDIANISYKGTLNGKAFDGGSADNYDLSLGSGSMIDGFESGLYNKKIGSTVTLHLTFPKDYSSKKLAGKKVVFKVKINSKKVTVTPKYDIAFIKANSEYDNKKDYENSVKADLLKSKKESAESTEKNELWNQVIDASKVKSYPKRQLEYEQENMKSRYTTMAKNYNMTLKKFVKGNGMTMKQFNKQLKSYAKSMAKEKLVMYSIAKKENIKISDKEYNQYLKKMLKEAGFTEASFKSQYNMTIEEYAEQNEFRVSYTLDKVLDKIKSSAKASEAKTDAAGTSSASTSK